MVDVIGAWTLLSCLQHKDGVATPTFGEPPSGQIQYTGDGRMSAFLMDPTWAVSGKVEADPFNEFFAYAGSWSLEGDTVHHDIAFCTTPHLIGTRFTRRIKALSKNEIELTTEPARTRSGAEYSVVLRWRRYGA